jgi:hypothetical protein
VSLRKVILDRYSVGYTLNSSATILLTFFTLFLLMASLNKEVLDLYFLKIEEGLYNIKPTAL